MQQPLVSIIIPTYNRAHLIGETLDSVIAQTYTNWECIVVDDGSTDDTASLLQKYCEKDSRIQYYHRPAERPKGANACRNYGFELSKGEYIKWFDSDDLMVDDLIESQMKLFEKTIDLDFVVIYGQAFKDNLNNKSIVYKPKCYSFKSNTEMLYDYITGHLFFMTPSPLWNRRFLIDKELFDSKLQRGQESDFHFKMLLNKPKFKFIDEIGFYVRRGHSSIESNSISSVDSHVSMANYFRFIISSIDKIGFSKSTKQILRKYLIFRILSIFLAIRSFKKIDNIILEKEMKKTRNSILNSSTGVLFQIYTILTLNYIMFIGRGYYFVFKLKKYDLRKNN